MTTLICGSIAYDTIMVFNGRFKEHILPDQVHILSVSFLVPEMRREFGGTGGNIAYNLKLLGDEPLLMGTLGSDGAAYYERLERLGIGAELVREVPETFTAQAFITTDLDDNQIIAFHPGAMNHADLNHVADAGEVSLGIVAPDGRAAMLQHAAEFAAAGIEFIFDPGQGLPMFDGPELLDFIDKAQIVAVNDYEAKLLCDRTGLSIEAIAARGKTVVVTRGAKGSEIHADGRHHSIPVAPAAHLADPTGCGDAYRAGLLHGMAHGMDWASSGRLASVMGALKIASRGPQNHSASRAEIGERFFEAYGYRPWD